MTDLDYPIGQNQGNHRVQTRSVTPDWPVTTERHVTEGISDVSGGRDHPHFS